MSERPVSLKEECAPGAFDPEGNRTRRDDVVVGVPAVTTEHDHDGFSRLYP